MTTATKTKRTLLRDESLSPPRELRENTKARRQWLAEKLAEINALPNREAKIVGTGSYQSLSVYEVKEVEGRLQHRGVCQFCGNSQVIDNGLLVLHGYKRPGDGYVWGQCPGYGLPPLNLNKMFTEKWLQEAIKEHESAKAAEQEALKAQEAAQLAHASALGEGDAYRNKPSAPRSRPEPTEEQKEAYSAAMREWATRYPLTAAYSNATREYEKARQIVWQTRGTREHFQRLIDSGIHGTELRKEVVA